ncbi:MAG: homoserine O-succinyltransferase [Rhodovibrionaceae bacterium]
MMHASLYSRGPSGRTQPPAWPGDRPLSAASERPLRIALVNLMPDKPTTERHFARAFAAAGRPVKWIPALPAGYRSNTTPRAYLKRVYRTWSALDLAALDGLIVTGAPLERLAYEKVRYWKGLTRIFDDARSHGLPCLSICWAAQAALYHFHGIPKRILPEKCFGVFAQEVLAPESPVLEGLGPRFHVPVSRHSEVRREDLPSGRGIELLAESRQSGLCLLAEPATRNLYMFNHLEYDADTLSREYARDRAAGLATAAPRHLPQGSAALNLWAGASQIFFANWARSLDHECEGRLYSTYSR